MIQIVEYREAWPAEFELIAAELRKALGELAVRVDHIGSTAVPGLAAKDRIDVQIGVRDLAALPTLRDALSGAGYRWISDIDDDHVPFGHPVTDPAEWRKAFFREAQTGRGANVHVREVGRANWRYALLFRDFLRDHALAAAAYAELKRRLAEHVDDIDTYSDIKDPAVDLVMVAAEPWASARGWRP